MLHGWDRVTPEEERAIIRGIVENKIHGGPYHAEFSPTDACNYECFFCNSAFVDRSKRLPWPVLERTLNELIDMGVRSIRLSGGGEPLIYPQIQQFLDIVHDRGVGISNVTTNAFKLTPAVVDRLLKIDTDEIIISFNDVDPKRYAATNGTTERAFDVVNENIRYLMQAREKRGGKKPTVIQQFFVWKGNCEEVERAYDLGLELGVDYIYLRDMFGIEPERVMTPEELATAGRNVKRLVERDKGVGKLVLNFSQEKILDEFKVAAEQQAEHRKSVKRAPLFRSERPSRKEYCYIGWYSTVVRGNGEVFPCCMLATNPGYPALGNVLESPDFRSIWEGANYARLRDELHRIAVHHGDYESIADPCFTRHFCAMRDACCFVAGLATPEFYDQADQGLAAARPAAPRGGRLRRMAESLLSRVS